MGIFNRKGKNEGWDDDAATEFHNKAPAARVSEIPARNLANPYELPTDAGNPVTTAQASSPAESDDPPVDAISKPAPGNAVESSDMDASPETAVQAPTATVVQPDVPAPVEAISHIPFATVVQPNVQTPVQTISQAPVAAVVQPDVQAPVQTISQAPEANGVQPDVSAPVEADVQAPEEQVDRDQAVDEKNDLTGLSAAGAPQSDALQPQINTDSEKEIPATSPGEAQETYVPVEDLAAYASRLLPIVQNMNADVKKYLDEKRRLSDKLRALKEDIDVLEAKTPEYESTLRINVDALNEALTEEFVAGVEAVEIPRYDAANELSGVIGAVQARFAEMLPALKKSKASASGMLETLVPESNMYEPTKALVDFAVNAIEKIETFFQQQNKLREDLEKALESYDSLSDAYQRTRTEAEANMKKIDTLADIIRDTIDEFQQIGADLEDIRWSVLDLD